MTSTTAAATATEKTNPRPVSLYESLNGDLYLRRDHLAYRIDPNWTLRLQGVPSPFRIDAEHWAVLAGPGDDNARNLGVALCQPGAPHRLIATLHPDGTIQNHQKTALAPNTRAYLGNIAPPAAKPAPAPRKVIPDSYDAVPKTLRTEPEVEVRLGPDLLLCLFRDHDEPQRWHLLAHDADGNFMSRWASGIGDQVPDGVWMLAADAIGRRHFIAKHGRRH